MTANDLTKEEVAALDGVGLGDVYRSRLENMPEDKPVERPGEHADQLLVDSCIGMGVPVRHMNKIDVCRQTSAVKAALEWVNSDSWLMMISGQPGKGKSFAAAYYMWVVTRSLMGPTGGWSQCGDLPDMDRQEVKTMKALPFLVLDDLGSEYYSNKGWFLARLYNILGYRYDNLLRTIITTNLSKKEVLKRYDDARLHRRLVGEDGDVLWFDA